MISARRAALLGLTTPLTAIMVAVLGLWPEPDDELDLPPLSGGAPGGKRKISWDDVADDDDLIVTHNRAVISAVVALVAAGVI